jgi:aspartate dehydrogenase
MSVAAQLAPAPVARGTARVGVIGSGAIGAAVMLPRTLLQPCMDEPTRHRIAEATEPVDVFRGGARDAARWFPRSLNVAATVAFAVGDFDAVEVVLVADRGAELTVHVIEADGDAGQYRFEIRNQPAPDNPRTSGIGGRKPAEPAEPAGRVGRVPFAVLRSLSVLVGRPVRIV